METLFKSHMFGDFVINQTCGTFDHMFGAFGLQSDLWGL